MVHGHIGESLLRQYLAETLLKVEEKINCHIKSQKSKKRDYVESGDNVLHTF